MDVYEVSLSEPSFNCAKCNNFKISYDQIPENICTTKHRLHGKYKILKIKTNKGKFLTLLKLFEV